VTARRLLVSAKRNRFRLAREREETISYNAVPSPRGSTTSPIVRETKPFASRERREGKDGIVWTVYISLPRATSLLRVLVMRTTKSRADRTRPRLYVPAKRTLRAHSTTDTPCRRRRTQNAQNAQRTRGPNRKKRRFLFHHGGRSQRFVFREKARGAREPADAVRRLHRGRRDHRLVASGQTVGQRERGECADLSVVRVFVCLSDEKWNGIINRVYLFSRAAFSCSWTSCPATSTIFYDWHVRAVTHVLPNVFSRFRV